VRWWPCSPDQGCTSSRCHPYRRHHPSIIALIEDAEKALLFEFVVADPQKPVAICR